MKKRVEGGGDFHTQGLRKLCLCFFVNREYILFTERNTEMFSLVVFKVFFLVPQFINHSYNNLLNCLKPF